MKGVTGKQYDAQEAIHYRKQYNNQKKILQETGKTKKHKKKWKFV